MRIVIIIRKFNLNDQKKRTTRERETAIGLPNGDGVWKRMDYLLFSIFYKQH